MDIGGKNSSWRVAQFGRARRANVEEIRSLGRTDLWDIPHDLGGVVTARSFMEYTQCNDICGTEERTVPEFRQNSTDKVRYYLLSASFSLKFCEFFV